MKILINKSLFLVILLGSLAWSVTMVKSGLIYDYGMGFWGPNGHDGIWHISVINGLSKGSLDMPIFAGGTIKNYHIGFDVLLSILHKITAVPVVNLYFQVIPPLIAVAVGLLVYKFVFLWKGSKVQALWATFFVYFAGSFGWIVTLIRNEGFGGESLFWAQQSLSTLINPPYALSLIFVFLTLIVLMKYQEKHALKYLVLTALLIGSLAQIKIYASILLLGAVFLVSIRELFRKKGSNLLTIFILSLPVSVFLLIPTFNITSGGLVFQPFWFLESMVATPDRFYWPKMASAIFNYKLAGNLVKETAAYTLTFLIFLLGNMGIKIIAFPWIGKKLKKINELDTYEELILSIVILGIMIPMLFIQKGNSWNSIQFFYYSLVFLSVISGISVGEYLEKVNARKADSKTFLNFVKRQTVTFMIILFSIPTTVATLRHYLPARPPAKISHEEIRALRFLKNLPDGIILTLPFDKELADMEVGNPPRPLYLYESTAYVSAMTNKSLYLEDEVNLEITGYDWSGRKETVKENLSSVSKLREMGIVYIYIPDTRFFKQASLYEDFKIYGEGNITIYKI